MGVINSYTQYEFESCKSLFAQIKEDLDSYDALGLIDNRTLYRHVKKVIADIGIGCYMEKQAVIPVSRYKAHLPEDFTELYSAYRCSSSEGLADRIHPQTGFVMYLENTCERIEHCKCDIEKVVDKITVRSYINETELIKRFERPTLLSLSTNTRNKFCAPDSPNMYCGASDQISISDGYISTNFESGTIYIKYYGFPFDDEGLPMIPNKEHIKTAVEDYIKFKLLEKWWLNSDSPNVQDKMLKMESNYRISIGTAKAEEKTPSFQKMFEYRKRTRDSHDVYQFNRM